MSDNKKMVQDAIKSASGPVSPGDIADATGLSKNEVAKHIKELKKEGKITSPKRSHYASAK